MKWEDVFDKSFNIQGSPDKVLVFLPGTYTGSHISYVWTTLKEIERGIDLFSLTVLRYGLYGAEVKKPGYVFSSHQPLVRVSQEERVCRKIKVMEERWNRFQVAKKKPKKVTIPKVRKSFDGYVYLP